MDSVIEAQSAPLSPISDSRVAGVVVTYNPDVDAVVRTIAALAGQVAQVFVVDNSDRPGDLSSAVKRFPNARFIDNGGNKGIANALNVAIAAASDAGAAYLVTLDQDSLLPPGYVAELTRFLDLRTDRGNIAILGGEYFTAGVRDDVRSMPESGEVEFLITSGNMLDLAIVAASGGFRDEFFIDYVDMDLCFRLRKQGYKIVQHPSLGFSHQVGESKWSKIGNVSFVASHHSAMRRYYMTRNRLVFFKENFSFATRFVFVDIYRLFKDTVKVVLVEQRKAAKLKAALLGLRDALIGRLGAAPYRF